MAHLQLVRTTLAGRQCMPSPRTQPRRGLFVPDAPWYDRAHTVRCDIPESRVEMAANALVKMRLWEKKESLWTPGTKEKKMMEVFLPAATVQTRHILS